MASTDGGAGRNERLCAGDHRSAGRNDVVDQQGGPAGEMLGSSKAISTERSPRRVFLRNCVYETPSKPGEIAHPGPRLRIRPDNDRVVVDTFAARRCIAMAGIAERLSASMPGRRR